MQQQEMISNDMSSYWIRTAKHAHDSHPDALKDKKNEREKKKNKQMKYSQKKNETIVVPAGKRCDRQF